jgi:GDPmannose 4,6-dehydratase
MRRWMSAIANSAGGIELRFYRAPASGDNFGAPALILSRAIADQCSRDGLPMKRALITGITGQDGSYLAEFLLRKGYVVHGLKRRASSFNTGRVDAIYDDLHAQGNRFFLHYADLADSSSLWKLLYSMAPDEVYNLAAQSHVRVSFDIPEYTADITATGALRLLEGIRETGIRTRFYQASSSEMFGSSPPPQNELTRFHPRSPYACAKVFAHSITVNYRESYGMFACCGILFNHESPRRGETFVTRKIARAAARIRCGLEEKLYIGNLDAARDWGYAPEYVEAMWMMLQQEAPDDYVIGTGERHTVREFLERAFAHAGLDWRDHVAVDSRYFRPAEVEALEADPSKARERLGWRHRVSFEELVGLMVDAELAELAKGSLGALDRATHTAS